MFDGIKILDLSVSVDALLINARLMFPLSIDEKNGAVLNRPRRANDRGLTFSLIPPHKAGNRLRCELDGSIHRYGRNGVHNADDFTAADLLTSLDDLVTTYGINPSLSHLNNIEFGINVRLPFPVSRVLDNLIAYKYRPFVKESGDGFDYYQCQTQRYVVKLYDKGNQYDLPSNVLRVEVKVLKMEYLTRRGIRLDWLTDLLNAENYEPLGMLLVETFTAVLFDEPTINPAKLTARERDIYQNGRNPRFWSIPDDLAGKEYERYRKALQRTEKAFRDLLNKHRPGNDWQRMTADLIGQTWERLSTIDDDLLSQIDEHRAAWHSNGKSAKTVRGSDDDHNKIMTEKCPKLTGVSQSGAGRETLPSTPDKCPKLTESEKGEMSQINPLSIVLISDIDGNQKKAPLSSRGTPSDTIKNHSKTDLNNVIASRAFALSESASVAIDKDTSPRPTATMLRSDAHLLDEVERGRKRYDKGSKENDFERAAHNLRNDDSNPRNNLARRLRRIVEVPHSKPLPLFAPAEVIRLTPEQRATLDHWQGTRYEINL